MQKLTDIKINIPKYPKHILTMLHNSGYEAYIVGGCVRDAMLGITLTDFDITTSAKPNEVKSMFRRTIDTGLKHGTVTVLFYENGEPYTYEVTTFRVDGEYDDSRHPKNVVYVDDLREDLLRRDFTINAMAYNDEVGLVDNFGGLVDLEKKKVSAVGKPIERFTEDALRLMRAVRFAAKLGFSIEEETKNAIPKLAKNLANISKERIQVELTKIITSNNPSYVRMLFELGLASYITNDFENIKTGKIEKNLSPYMAYACMFYNTDVNVVFKILKELKFDNNTIFKVTTILSAKQYLAVIEEYYKTKKIVDFKISIKELINNIKYDLFYDLLKVVNINEGSNIFTKKVEKYVKECQDENVPIYISDLNIDGKEILNMGYNGQEVGVALSSLLKIVHKYPAINDNKKLYIIASEAYKLYKGGYHELS